MDWIPLWLNEGLAEFYQNTDIGEREVRLGQPSSDDILYLRQNRLLPLPVLFKVDHSSPYYHEEQKGSVFYAESWALTHYLMASDFGKTTTRLTEYMKLVSDDPNNALAHESMGFLKFREGDIAGAKKWYGEAVQLDSQSYVAHYYFAAMSMRDGDHDRDEAIESSLQASIKLNPQFAPAYDALAGFYVQQHIKLNDAHILNIQAVTIDPGNIRYRINGANILMEDGQPENAIRVLDAAARVTKDPAEVAMVQSTRQRIEQFESARERVTARGAVQTTVITGGNGGAAISTAQPVAPEPPKYPTEPSKGPHHTARGILHDVQCSYPSVIKVNVEASGRKVMLYSNNFYKVDYSATNFEPGKDFNPCKALEGMKAVVEYAEVSDKSIAGQILSIQLTK